MPPGSSPLARGLRQSVTVSKRGDGIIPARAGFTRLDASSTSHEPDHPRSRGVYRDCPCPLPFPCGSSPLARGLLGRIELVRDLLGIIPARAGFTGLRGGARLPRPDHPRSRGVYAATSKSVMIDSGSSPLARGLLRCQRRALLRHGIIPARAGFTGRPASHRLTETDHPRSRGVYNTTTTSTSWLPGSSPLARGLRFLVFVLVGALGIIPARAGFTCRDSMTRSWAADHPRSRGVYMCLQWSLTVL